MRVKQHKNSDTVVIFGSGSSINEINEDQWNFIRSVDTIGFNLWFIHDFIPTYYHSETFRYAHELEPLLRLQKEFAFRQRYQNILFITSEKDKKLGWHPIYRPEVFPKAVKIYTYPGYLSKKFLENSTVNFDELSLNLGDHVWRVRSGLTSIIHLAVQIGYKKIILSGVDLYNRDNFYSKSINLTKYGFHINPEVHTGKGLHSTVFSSGGKMGVVEFIRQLSEYLSKYDITIFVSNKKSLLSEFLPYHSLQASRMNCITTDEKSL